MQRALVFPGQGAQYVGQGKGFAEQFPEARSVFESADAILGFELSKICFEGPEDELNRTDICQPAILATSWAIVTTLLERGRMRREDFDATCGLSLGEYTALVFAGALELEDALRLVRKRGQFMQEASEAKPSGMSSLMGLEREQAEAVCREASSAGIVQVANLNSPGQIVISGELAALDRADELAKEAGARRAIRLKVAGAFHSPVMAPAAEKLRAALADVTIRPPELKLLTNVTGDFVSDPEEIRRSLAEQILRPVLWEDTMRRCVASGLKALVEPGPNKVLQGLMRKIDSGVETKGIDDPGAVASFSV
ncbi:MAG: ACP S-malonyltransferase [Planctomycetota bacterium]